MRKTNNRKRDSILVIVIILLILVFASFKFISYMKQYGEMHNDADPYIDTIFTKDFTINKFNNISKGMTEEEVVNLIGEPLEKHIAQGSATQNITPEGNLVPVQLPDTTKDCWSYSTDGKLGKDGDASWYSYVVCFKDHRVESTVVNEFFD